MVFDDTIDLVPILLRIAAFFRDESCGQCVPCRVGTVRQEEALRGSRRSRTGLERASCAARRDRHGDEGRIDLRPRADGVQRGRVGDQAASTVPWSAQTLDRR
jgi:hypothetical protein